MLRQEKAAIAGIVIYGAIILFNLSLIGGVIYIACHFLKKIW